jgi:hypothetical protein
MGIQEQHPASQAFEEALKATYVIEDSKGTRRGFEDWMVTLDKGLKVLEVFT